MNLFNLFTPFKGKRKLNDCSDETPDTIDKTECSNDSAKRRKLRHALPQTSPRRASRRTKPGTQLKTAPTERLVVAVFGCGEDGELGLGNMMHSGRAPTVADRPRINHFLDINTVGVVQIAVGGKHCAALTHDGLVLTWGCNDSRALGRATQWERLQKLDQIAREPNSMPSVPAPVENLSTLGLDIAQLTATDNATFILTRSGLVYGWGTFHGSDGVYGFLREKIQKNKPASYEARFQATPTRIEGLKNIRELSAGMNHVLALTESGDVYAWGSGQQAQLGRRLVQRHQFESLIPRMVDLPKRGIVKIFAGFSHSFAVDTQGKVWTWGLNNFGQTGIPANEENLYIGVPTVVQGLTGYKIRQVAGGFHHSIACTEDGQVLAWGRCDNSQMGTDILMLGKDKFLFDSRGRPRILLTPTVIPSISATFVAAGVDNSVAIAADGAVLTWGSSENYRTGLATQDTIQTPTELVGKGVTDKAFTFAGCGSHFTVIAGPGQARRAQHDSP
ncbi:uncharacterized protein UV8b_04293 [Ustilaginoidea virens]|uniref:RCC1-like domain-containing protein n=1 Tax=Ustilaginoidea virens TaxID=1159556 RepID=A0A8E5HRA8_USTVR|nr:uncharacterized protein UV8b_04293 [Ustilaginoidea virens]QUC20052.1 hypothetical protein UV8b_04293 [Ustilaginoidea virens]